MGREGTQGLLDALLVSDIGENFVENGKLRVVEGRNVKTCLAHQGEKADSFQGNGLTSGVRSGDDQKAEILSEPDIDGNHAFLVQQGMAAFFDVDVAFFIEDRLGSVVGFAEHGPGKNEIQLGQDPEVIGDVFIFRSGHIAEFGKNRLDGFLLLKLQFAKLIIEFYDGHGLDEKGGTCGRLVVDHAGNLSLVLRFDRNAVAAVSHRDYGVLKVSSGRAVHQGSQLGVNPVVGLADGCRGSWREPGLRRRRSHPRKGYSG